MPQNTEERNPAPTTTQAEAEAEAEAEECPPGKTCGADDFDPRPDLDGKTDSGPEPDVYIGN